MVNIFDFHPQNTQRLGAGYTFFFFRGGESISNFLLRNEREWVRMLSIFWGSESVRNGILSARAPPPHTLEDKRWFDQSPLSLYAYKN